MSSSSSVSPRLAREDYDAFKILLRDDREFPDTFEAWQSLLLRSDVQRVNSGHKIVDVRVTPREFKEYCRAIGHGPTVLMLLACAVAKAAKGTGDPSLRSG
jgi:hypothetical protein